MRAGHGEPDDGERASVYDSDVGAGRPVHAGTRLTEGGKHSVCPRSGRGRSHLWVGYACVGKLNDEGRGKANTKPTPS